MSQIANLFKRFQYLTPVIFVVIYIGFIFFIRGEIPNTLELIKTLRNAYIQHGYYVVFAGGLLEGNFLTGFYIPGSTMMLLGAAFAKEGIIWLPYVLLCAAAGLVLSYCINYVLGKYGWFHILSRLGFGDEVEAAKLKIEQYGGYAFLFGYSFPGSAAFLSTAAGITRMPFWKFLLFSILAQSLWTMLWGGAAFAFGLPLVELMLKYFVFVIVALAILWLFKKLRRKKI